MTFGDKLSALRREQNYTQEQLAELLGVSPVSYTHLTLPTICSV